MDHSVKRRGQALHQTHHHYYLNISVEAANLSDWRIESNRKNRFGSDNRIESNRNFFARIGMLYPVHARTDKPTCLVDVPSVRSARTNRLLVPSVKLSTVGGRAIAVAGPIISGTACRTT